jgi:hypothetical protein
MAEAKKSSPKAEEKSESTRVDGPTGSDAKSKGFYGRESALPNERYELQSSDKPHPNEETHEAKVRGGERDPKNTGKK